VATRNETQRKKTGARLTVTQAREVVRAACFSFPLATEDFPWGESAFKVDGKKVFLFAGGSNPENLYVGVKLAEGLDHALSLAQVKRMEYGLGAHGWVGASFDDVEEIPIDLILEWIDESYRLVAPKKLVKELDAKRSAPKS
jgi:predicted DNA-binding protein (MmcQ/YjbR family)